MTRPPSQETPCPFASRACSRLEVCGLENWERGRPALEAPARGRDTFIYVVNFPFRTPSPAAGALAERAHLAFAGWVWRSPGRRRARARHVMQRRGPSFAGFSFVAGISFGRVEYQWRRAFSSRHRYLLLGSEPTSFQLSISNSGHRGRQGRPRGRAGRKRPRQGRRNRSNSRVNTAPSEQPEAPFESPLWESFRRTGPRHCKGHEKNTGRRWQTRTNR